ncbi:MAG: hypothetical protein HYZ11_06135 [Candidatus Tectomicrobia bacterium]|uniref:Uncharacterized protein n=1 Tax=Tectimicrobiota bacterium TaxID=2528274 RepID=A0A932HY37_UNCTE|nr:hypothetical protein [Candidatus Tectomicrobia bacterium]
MAVFTKPHPPKTTRGVSRKTRLGSGALQEGVLAGLIGAAMIAVWFLLVDTLQGRPFHTPDMLGRVLFQGASPLAAGPVSFQTVFLFTWIHTFAFMAIGVAAAFLIRLAGRNPNYGFGVLLLLVIVAFEFTAFSLAFAREVIYAITLPFILIGNFLAAGAMAYHFWRCHRGMRVYP